MNLKGENVGVFMTDIKKYNDLYLVGVLQEPLKPDELVTYFVEPDCDNQFQEFSLKHQPVPRSMIKPKPNNQESKPVLLQDTSSSTSRSIYEDNNLISSQSILILKENE